jgi:two-component system chemotaxis response regulator CheB
MKLHPMPAVIISSEEVRGNEIFDDGTVGFGIKPTTNETMQIFQNKIKDTLLNLTFLFKRYTLKKPKQIGTTSKQTKKIDLTNKIERKIHQDEVYPNNPSFMLGAKIIAIGSSTGGVETLLTIFKKLPSNLPPIVITQHIPYGFSSSFAQRLNDNSEVKVQEVNKNDIILEKGNAYLASGNMHLTIEKKANNYITKVSHYKPSVDMLFRSVNNSAGGSAMAIMLTGMGDDRYIAMQIDFAKNKRKT